MSNTNHRRKCNRHHKAYSSWTGNKQYRQVEWGKFRARERDCLKKWSYDDLPQKVPPTAWYYIYWY